MLPPDQFVQFVCRTCNSLPFEEEESIAQLILSIPTLRVDDNSYAMDMCNLDPHVLIEEISKQSGYIKNILLLIRVLTQINYCRIDEISARDLIDHVNLFDIELKKVMIVLGILRVLKYKYTEDVLSELASVFHRYIPNSAILDLVSAVYMIADAGVNLKGEDLNALYKRIEAEADTIDAEILMDYLE